MKRFILLTIIVIAFVASVSYFVYLYLEDRYDEAQVVIAFITGLATVFAAWFAASAASEAKNAVKAQVIASLSEIYFGSDMLHAMTAIRAWKKTHDKDFASKLATEIEKNTGEHLDSARRLVKSYYARLFRLYEAEVISKNDLNVLLHEEQLEFLLDLIKPLEEALADSRNKSVPKIDQRMYKHFEQMLGQQQGNAQPPPAVPPPQQSHENLG